MNRYDPAAPAHDFACGTLTARVLAQGGELCSLTAGTRECLWQAGPAWPRHAPVLFPIVGRLAGDTLRHNGQAYPMDKHGFAREMRFDWLERTPTGCRLVLTDDAATRAQYPFAFRFELVYALSATGLTMELRIINPVETILPASMGAHPAFRWPQFPDIPKSAHSIVFDADEPAPIRVLRDGLILPIYAPSPIAGRTLALTPHLFDADAIILDAPRSRAATLSTPAGPAVRVAWQDATALGIWSKPGTTQDADFVCIEPWYGHASPTDFDGEFRKKPGVLLIPPYQDHRLTLSITPA